MSDTSATPAQLAAVGFAALAIGKAFDALEAVHFPLDDAQYAAMTQAVGGWLRERHGDAAVDAAKQALGDGALGSDDAEEDEIDAAVEAAKQGLAASFAILGEQRADAIEAAHQAGLAAIREALAEAYGEEAVSMRWSSAL